MSQPARIRRRAYWGALLVMTLVSAACSPSDGESTATSAPVATTESSVATTAGEPTTEAPRETVPDVPTTMRSSDRTRRVDVVDPAGVAQADPAWVKQVESFFVWGVDPDDVLNVRTAPGIANPVIATIEPDSGMLKIYDVIERVGSTSWVAVELTLEGGVGWVASGFLKPQAPPGSPVVTGSASPELEAMVSRTISAFSNPEALLDLVGPQGLTIAPFTFIGEETQTLTPIQLLEEAGTERTWGFQTGTGDPIKASLEQYLQGLASRNAITSTVEISYDDFIGGGNSINNLRDVFADATIVEYYHPGTDFYGGLDWNSVRFVFLNDGGGDDGGNLVLRALVSDQWEI